MYKNKDVKKKMKNEKKKGIPKTTRPSVTTTKNQSDR